MVGTLWASLHRVQLFKRVRTPEYGCILALLHDKPGKSGFAEVTFHDPKRGAERVPFSHVSAAVVSSLHFVLKLLERIGETEVAPQVKSVLEALPR